MVLFRSNFMSLRVTKKTCSGSDPPLHITACTVYCVYVLYS
jgi:hypothetical protein